MIQTQENGEKPHFGPDFDHWAEVWAAKFFFPKMYLRQSLDIMVSYHHVRYQKKLMFQS